MGRRRRHRVFPRKSRLARFEQLEPRQLLAVTNLPITNSPDVQQMPSVAVDPNDAKHVVVAYMDYSLTPPLPGDYNGDRLVDAADYTVWQDTLGSTTNLLADGNGNHGIDAGDLTVWSSHFGQAPMPASAWPNQTITATAARGITRLFNCRRASNKEPRIRLLGSTIKGTCS